jgi:arabinose operon protein AraL
MQDFERFNMQEARYEALIEQAGGLDNPAHCATISRETQQATGVSSQRCSMVGKNCRSALAGIKVAVIDLDGVVYQGGMLIEGADRAIFRIRASGLRVFFATNSSVRTRADIAAKLRGMSVPAEEDEVVTSAYVAGFLVRDIGAEKVLVIGAEGLKKEVGNVGATVVSEPPCDVVVVGMDTAFSYHKIHMAMEAIARGAKFVACNRDGSFPGSDGRMFPGCGPMVAAIEAAVDMSPHYIAGKPNVCMLKAIAAQYHVGPDEILVVGDGMASDIEMAIAFGSPSVLVAPGTPESNRGTKGPTCTIESLVDLPSLLGGKPGS